MSLNGEKVNSDYKKKLRSVLELNKKLFEKIMKGEVEKRQRATQDLLYSGISDSGLKLIDIDNKTKYFKKFQQEVIERIDGTHIKENRI